MSTVENATGRDHILLVEDSAADVYLFRMAAAELLPGVSVRHVQDGAEALLHLEREAYEGSGDGELPRLILLDLNLPRLNGFDVLSAIKTDEKLKDIPVVIWSSSAQAAEVRRGYELGARLYLLKGSDWSEFFASVVALSSLLDGAGDGASRPEAYGAARAACPATRA